MNINQMQQDITIIKNMIEKTKQKTAASGSIFILIGLAGIVYVLVTMVFEKFLNHLALPIMIGMTIICGIGSVILFSKKKKTMEVKTYTEMIGLNVLAACFIPMLITTFLFPLTRVYAYNLAPIFSALFFGIILFIAAAVYEFQFLYWAGITAWAGACGLAYIEGYFRGLIMVVILFIGFVVPGFILNKRYRNGGQENGS